MWCDFSSHYYIFHFLCHCLTHDSELNFHKLVHSQSTWAQLCFVFALFWLKSVLLLPLPSTMERVILYREKPPKCMQCVFTSALFLPLHSSWWHFSAVQCTNGYCWVVSPSAQCFHLQTTLGLSSHKMLESSPFQTSIKAVIIPLHPSLSTTCFSFSYFFMFPLFHPPFPPFCHNPIIM